MGFGKQKIDPYIQIMSYRELIERMRSGGVVLIDGATGTELEKRGAEMDPTAWCGPANLTNRALLEEIHFDYIKAGAEIIITNTYASSRLLLEPAGYADRIEEIYRESCAAALSARKRSEVSDVLVAGALSHRVPFDLDANRRADPYIGLGREAFASALHEAAGLLKKGGCDLIMLEMMQHPERMEIAVEAALATGLPVWAGLAVRAGSNGKVLSYEPDRDIPFEDIVALLPEDRIDAVGVMHSSVDITGPALRILAEQFDGPRFAYPDSGYFTMPNWQFVDIIPPAKLTNTAKGWIEDGLSAVGGCCGLSLEHIEALAGLKR